MSLRISHVGAFYVSWQLHYEYGASTTKTCLNVRFKLMTNDMIKKITGCGTESAFRLFLLLFLY